MNKILKYSLIILGIIFGLVFIGAQRSPQKSLVPTTPTPEPSPIVIGTATLSGIERDESSDAFGELVIPEINLWNSYGSNRGWVVGYVPHNTKVEILDQITEAGVSYFKIRARGGLMGWVSELFVIDIQTQ